MEVRRAVSQLVVKRIAPRERLHSLYAQTAVHHKQTYAGPLSHHGNMYISRCSHAGNCFIDLNHLASEGTVVACEPPSLRPWKKQVGETTGS